MGREDMSPNPTSSSQTGPHGTTAPPDAPSPGPPEGVGPNNPDNPGPVGPPDTGTGTGPSGPGPSAGSPGGVMHRGGRIGGLGQKQVTALGGETIMNREASKAFSPYLDAMNSIQDEHSDNASTLKRLINKAVLHLAG
jgi:hypothetical protein